MFATTSDLGYDPTITRRTVRENIAGKDTDVISYQYTVDGKSYLTQGHPISEDAAYLVCSRATRVWHARQMTHLDDGNYRLGDDLFVLKDAWLHRGAKMESTIRDNIFQRLRQRDSIEGTNDAEDADRYFLHIEADWHVAFDGGYSDCTFPHPKGAKSASFQYGIPMISQSHVRGSQRTPVSDRRSDKMPSKSLSIGPKCPRRMHVRTVFQEVCRSIYEVNDVHTLISTLRDVVTGMAFLLWQLLH